MVGNAAAVTLSVTDTVFGLFEAPDDVMLTVPVYVPAAKAWGLTETLTLPGVLPLAGVAVSQVAEVETV